MPSIKFNSTSDFEVTPDLVDWLTWRLELAEKANPSNEREQQEIDKVFEAIDARINDEIKSMCFNDVDEVRYRLSMALKRTLDARKIARNTLDNLIDNPV